MEDCIFCKVIKGEAKSWKVYEDDQTYAFLDINPVNRYHTLVVPKKHFKDIFEADDECLIGISKAIKTIVDLYKNKLGINNIQVINSSGSEAQQDVFHLHFHIVPRYNSDGQDIKWTTHKEWRIEFDDLIKRI